VNITLIIDNVKQFLLRLTNGICSPPCSGGSGSAKHRSCFALCGILLHHILQLLVLLRKPLSATAKRHIPKTLCAIHLDIILEI